MKFPHCMRVLWPACLVLWLAACGTPPPTGRAPGATSAVTAPPAGAALRAGVRDWSELPGWRDDDLLGLWPAWLRNCETLMRKPDWHAVCARARDVDPMDVAALRGYFERNFEPHLLANEDGTVSGLITGYYEPVLHGSRQRHGPYQYALYQYPPAWRRNKPNPAPTRAALQRGNLLTGHELVWVDDAVEAAFLQVQGSGRVLLDDGTMMRVVYAGSNDLPYQSIGRWLLDQREITPAQATMAGIKAWARAHPDRVDRMLEANPRFVFFAEHVAQADTGPPGSLGVPLTAERSIAVDPARIPLGAPVFLATTRPLSAQPLRRLVLAQDTGSAIRGTVRADFFWGAGDAAGEQAGRMRQAGSLWLLLPRR